MNFFSSASVTVAVKLKTQKILFTRFCLSPCQKWLKDSLRERCERERERTETKEKVESECGCVCVRANVRSYARLYATTHGKKKKSLLTF